MDKTSSRRGPSVISVIGVCASPGCDRPARVHVAVEAGGRVVHGAVCERCRTFTLLGAALLGTASRGVDGLAG